MNKFFTCLFLFVPFLTFAQSNYHQGFVVLNSWDTVRGYINLREWEITPKTIELKTSLQEHKAINYNPSLLRSFEFIGADKYITYTGKISMDAIDFNSAPTGIDTTTRQDTVFLKVLYAGPKVSFLNNTDKIKQRLFVQEAGRLPVELIFHQYLVEQARLYLSNEYKRQLQSLVAKYNDPEQAKQLIKVINFNIDDIEKVIRFINQDQTSQKNTSNSRFFVGGGITHQTTEFEGTNEFTKVGKVNYTAPFISVGIDVFQNPHIQKLILRGEVSVSYNAPKFSYPVSYLALPGENATYSFNQLNFGITPQIIYNFYNSDVLKIYLDAGIAFNFSTYSNNKYSVSGTNIYDRKNYYELASSWANFPLKAGVLLNKRLEIFAVYIYPGTYTKYVDFSISTQSLGVGMHYCFDKSK